VVGRRGGRARASPVAIIDVEGGAQPLENETGSVRVVCNGEIYNYRELRWRSRPRAIASARRATARRSSTSTRSTGPTPWRSYTECSRSPSGTARSSASCSARDRLGIKPLFYSGVGPRGFGFASEIKALLAARLSRREVDPDALLQY